MRLIYKEIINRESQILCINEPYCGVDSEVSLIDQNTFFSPQFGS